MRAFVLLFSTALMADPYYDSILKWRADAEARLKSDTGWLTVAGLFWLEPGRNAIGATRTATVGLPAGSAPAQVGSIVFHDGKATLEAAPGITVQINGQPVTRAVLHSDEGGSQPDVVVVNDRLSLFVIKRGDRWAVRLRDKQSALRAAFTHRTWMPVNPAFQIDADWTPFEPGRTMPVPNILNQVEQLPSPGRATFVLNGQIQTLEPVLEGDQLFFIFRDKTAGQETYPAGRFLYTALPQNGKVILDFNKAYNPPCAFTPFATCPLPPKSNQLAVRIEAGELNYGDH
jgi:uncharacterized protein (DUF1684 family)